MRDYRQNLPIQKLAPIFHFTKTENNPSSQTNDTYISSDLHQTKELTCHVFHKPLTLTFIYDSPKI